MAYPVPNIEQWVYGMKTIVELNDSLLEEIKHHAARHHTTLRAVLERVPHHFLKRWTTTTTPFPHAARDVLGERPAGRNSGGELEPDSIPHPRGESG